MLFSVIMLNVDLYVWRYFLANYIKCYDEISFIENSTCIVKQSWSISVVVSPDNFYIVTPEVVLIIKNISIDYRMFIKYHVLRKIIYYVDY